jgi:hypothetical protein
MGITLMVIAGVGRFLRFRDRSGARLDQDAR